MIVGATNRLGAAAVKLVYEGPDFFVTVLATHSGVTGTVRASGVIDTTQGPSLAENATSPFVFMTEQDITGPWETPCM